MAKFYDSFMRRCEIKSLGSWRSELLSKVSGDVLEIGAGTGANLQYYPDTLKTLTLSEPNADMREKLNQCIKSTSKTHIKISADSAEKLNMKDESFDCIVSTLVLCSVNDENICLAEIKRLLRPGGAFYFLEHVSAKHNPKIMKWQRRIEPFWKFTFGNCHLTKDTESTINKSGLLFEELDEVVMRSAPSVIKSVIKGIARKAKT